MKTIMKNKDIY